VTSNWHPEEDMSQNQQIDFAGSDDDIRSHFEGYVTQLMASAHYDLSEVEPGVKKVVQFLNLGNYLYLSRSTTLASTMQTG
jgi:hypothetical protein